MVILYYRWSIVLSIPPMTSSIGDMTADGHKVTMPLYWEIEALDHDLYLCATKNGDKVIVNGKGEIVR